MLLMLLLVLLVLTPFVTVAEVNQALGPGKLTALPTQSQLATGDTRVAGGAVGGERQ